MTRVFYDEWGNVMEISGHAGAGTKGYDLVCAAATILMRTLQAAVMEEPAHFLPNVLKRDGYVRIECNPKTQWKARCRVIYKTIFIGYELLATQYPENVQTYTAEEE